MAESSNHITRGPKDRTRVDVDQLWEVECCCSGLGVRVMDVLEALR
jgi:hypothetical protein